MKIKIVETESSLYYREEINEIGDIVSVRLFVSQEDAKNYNPETYKQEVIVYHRVVNIPNEKHLVTYTDGFGNTKYMSMTDQEHENFLSYQAQFEHFLNTLTLRNGK